MSVLNGSLLHVYHFQFENESLWLFVVQKMESEKEKGKRAPGLPPQTSWKSVDITRRHFWGARLRDWMAPSTKHSLLSDTHSHTLPHSLHAHTLTTQGTIPPTALSPHLFPPNIIYNILYNALLLMCHQTLQGLKMTSSLAVWILNRSSGVQESREEAYRYTKMKIQ